PLDRRRTASSRDSSTAPTRDSRLRSSCTRTTSAPATAGTSTQHSWENRMHQRKLPSRLTRATSSFRKGKALPILRSGPFRTEVGTCRSHSTTTLANIGCVRASDSAESLILPPRQSEYGIDDTVTTALIDLSEPSDDAGSTLGTFIAALTRKGRASYFNRLAIDREPYQSPFTSNGIYV
ncbi:hypothetical protein PENTCL1PPCAC_30743, partial [Pristionchus entomophagus]